MAFQNNNVDLGVLFQQMQQQALARQAGPGNNNTDWNKIYEQANHTGDYTPTMFGELTRMGGYGYDLGSAMNGAMNQMYQINEGNANRNALENQVMGQYRAAVDPIQIQEAGKTARMGQLSPLLSGVLGGLGGMLGGGGSSGGSGGGLQGFSASGPDGKQYASASLPGAGGGSALGQAQPGNASAALPTPTAQWNPASARRLNPQEEAAWFAQHPGMHR